ncbi:MAG: hypothetical protein ACE361_08755 [Aureliella sp.]
MNPRSPIHLSLITITVLGCLGVPSISWAQGELQLNEKTVLTFASKAEGARLLTKEDVFLEHMQPLERQIRLQSKEPVSKADYLASLSNGVLEFKLEEKQRLAKAVEQLSAAMQRFELPFPSEIHLIRVSKDVESNAPHCRGASIVLPDRFFADDAEVEKVLAHELFHVLSNQNRGLRDKLYSIIGFTRCNEIELPASIFGRRLTNPDAPTYEHYITLDQDGGSVVVTPIIITKSAEYQPGGLFQNIDFQLLVLQESEGKFAPKLNDGKPELISPRDAPDYLKQIGTNTNYIVHPEETLADNFWMLVLKAKEVRDPWVIQKLGAALRPAN